MRSTFPRVLTCALFLGGMLVGCQADDQPNTDHPAGDRTGAEVNTLAAVDSGLTVVGYSLDPELERVTGSVMNNSGQDYVNVQVAFDLYDSQGRQVGTVRDSVGEVQPGDVWTFGISTAEHEGITSVKPAGVTGTYRELSGQDYRPDTSVAGYGPPAPVNGEVSKPAG